MLAVGSFAVAIALRGGGTIDVFGIHVRAHTLYTPMLLLTMLRAGARSRSPSGRGCRCGRERQPDRGVRA